MKNLVKVLTESASLVSNVTGDKNIISKNGFRNILSDPALTKDYIQSLTEGFNADHRATLGAMMNETMKRSVLLESYDTLSPYQALSLPLLRVLWPYNSIKDVMQTVVATAPTFMIQTQHYYLTKRNKETGEVTKYELPANSAMIADEPHGQLAKAVATGAAANLTVGVGANAFSVMFPEAQFMKDGEIAHTLTNDIQVTSITFGDTAVVIPKHSWNNAGNIILNYQNQLIYSEGVHEVRFTGQIILLPVLSTGKITVVMTGAISGTASGTDVEAITPTITIKGSASERYNENHMSFSYETESFTVSIPDGKRVSAALPVELVQDIKNLYDLDTASIFGSGMRKLFGDAFDIEGIAFFKETINAAYPGKLDAALNHDGMAAAVGADRLDNVIPIRIFNTQPQVGYMGDPIQWRENVMKDQIRHITTTLEKEWYIKHGKVTLIANPIDADLLHGVNWEFEAGVAADGDVTADYSVGTFRSASRMYKLVTTQRAEEGIVWVLLTPSEADVMTLRHYPYYFGLEAGNGYRDPNTPNVPSVTFIRRHKFERHIPALGALVVKNNAGFPLYTGFNYTR